MNPKDKHADWLLKPTANELADALDWVSENHLVGIGDADFKATATMLRQQQAEINTLRNHGYKTQYELLRIEFLQQQAEIEALKQIIDANNLNQNIGQFVKPTNEPVAWMDDCSFFTEQPDDMDGVIPLYTHPVKELTDEEIMVLYEEYIETQYASESNVLGFGRTILRKAQEK